MSEQDQRGQRPGGEEPRKHGRHVKEDGGVPNPATGAGLGAGESSTFEGEEDADTAADK
ncbi:hypothetical protein [Georgenia ruanii]|uniref:hypothetical protein n=1 Tax=Georgenia ruanii TaxID=348442 RepID=UPI00186AE193|nr:hypothetical protein [Georgenia ruanii]